MKKVIFLAAAAALAQRPWPPPGMQCPQRTLVVVEVSPDAEKLNRFYDEHIAHLVPMMKSGKVVSGGPTADGRGVLVYASTDWAEVEAAMKKEPFTREGVTKVVSHTVWNACEAAK